MPVINKAMLALHRCEVLSSGGKTKARDKDPYDRDSTKLLASEERHV